MPKQKPPAETAASTSVEYTTRPDEYDHDTVSYECPHCDATYGHELFTRVHITRATDHKHMNHNGFMPEAEIPVSNANGMRVDTLRNDRPEQLDTQTLTPAALPDEHDTRHKHVILTAARNPHEISYKTLASKANDELERVESDTLSYSTIRRVIKDFYNTDSTAGTDDTTQTSDTKQDSLGELTPLQQTLLTAKLAHPDESNSTLAARANNASKSYPGQVTNEYDTVWETLKQRHDNGESIAAILADELSTANIKTLVYGDYLTDIAVDTTALEAACSDNQATAAEDVSDAQTTSPDAKPMSATPYQETTSADNTQDTTPERPQQPSLNSPTQTNTNQNDTSTDTTPDSPATTEPTENTSTPDTHSPSTNGESLADTDNTTGNTTIQHEGDDTTHADDTPSAGLEHVRDKITFMIEATRGLDTTEARVQHETLEQVKHEIDTVITDQTPSESKTASD